ncbi:MAG: DUF2304 domain-containing protein [bacterium]|nr:DUF2304 domain-containing protein [bacterium]
MTNIQIVASIFGLAMIYMTFLQYKRGAFNRYQFVIWVVLFLSFVIVIWLPDKFNFITERLGISRAFDLFSIIAFVIILFLTFHNYLLITRIEKRLETKVREKTLTKVDSFKDKQQ